MRVAVLGATGTIGRPLVHELVRAGHDVRAVSRSGRDVGAGSAVVADAVDAAAVSRALDGVEVAYHLVHSLGSRDFEERDRRAADTVAAEVARAGVRQLVYLGGIGDADAGLSPHLRSRAETAQRLAAGAVPVTSLGAAMVIGPGSAAFETILALVDRLPGMICPRWVSVPTQPVALIDVVRCLAGVAGLEAARGRHFDVGGPEVMTYREMIERIARLRGRRPLIVEVPFLTPRLSSLWLYLVTPVQASVARPLVEGLRFPTVAREHAIRDLLDFEPTPFDEAARETLASRR